MRKTSFAIVFAAAWIFAGVARADASAPEQSVPVGGQLDPRVEAELRFRADADRGSIVIGGMATSLGATMLFSGVALATRGDWSGGDCAVCAPSVIFMMGGTQLTLAGLLEFISYGGPHRGKGRARHIDRITYELEHPSSEDASSSRRRRLALGWSLIGSGAALFAGTATLFAIGHQPGFGDDARMGIAAGSAFVGSWLLTIGALELATKWDDELALAPARGGAVFSWSRRWW